jgi:hypothetical protein
MNSTNTLVHCQKIAPVINYYNEKIGLLEKILILVLIIESFPNSCLKLKKSLTHAS